MKKLFIAIFSILLAGAVAFLVWWGVNNYKKVEEGLKGTSLYTQEDLDQAYKDGYNTALSDKGTLEGELAELRATLTEQQARLEELIVLSEKLTAENSDLSEEVKRLTNEVTNLTKSIEEYENFVKDVEESNKVIATFMFDGAIYNLQSYNPGETVVAPENPEDTDKLAFEGWALNGEMVDVNGYVINESVTFDAITTPKFTTEFYVNGTVYKSVTVKEGESFVAPEEPTAEYGYEFAGWSLDGQIVETIQTTPENDQKYTAVFEIITIELKLSDLKLRQRPAFSGNYYWCFNIEIISGNEYINLEELTVGKEIQVYRSGENIDCFVLNYGGADLGVPILATNVKENGPSLSNNLGEIKTIDTELLRNGGELVYEFTLIPV